MRQSDTLILKQTSMHSQTCAGTNQAKITNFGFSWNMEKSYLTSQRRLYKL